jgi:hypothetical protein
MRDTIDMAREAGWKDLRDYDSEMRHDFFMGNTDSLKAFEALVRADERKQIALDKKAENARELGLDYDPAGGTQVSKVWWDGKKLMAKPISLEDIYLPAPIQQLELPLNQDKS